MEAETIIESLEEKTTRILNLGFKYCYEDNPGRVGWEFHKVNADFTVLPEFNNPDAYYMIELYLLNKKPELYDALFSITEGLPCFIETYKSGRCSIQAMIDIYTPENLERHLEEAEKELELITIERNNFIKLNK